MGRINHGIFFLFRDFSLSKVENSIQIPLNGVLSAIPIYHMNFLNENKSHIISLLASMNGIIHFRLTRDH